MVDEQALVESVLDRTVRAHFDALHAAGICIPWEQVSERSKSIVRNQQRGAAQAAVNALRDLQPWPYHRVLWVRGEWEHDTTCWCHARQP